MPKPFLRSLPALFLCLALLGAAARAQSANGAKEEVLTNESVVTMTRAGLSPNIIIGKINTAPTNFDLSTAELLRLKRERVADAVVEAMLGAANRRTAAKTESLGLAGGSAPARKMPDGIELPEEPGIYVVTGADGRRSLTQLEPSVYSQAKTGGMFSSALTYGLKKVKTKAVLATAQARLRVGEPRPVFYFYFESRNSGLSGYGHGLFGPTTSPNEFVLLRMEAKKSSREVVIMQGSMWGVESGTMDKYAQAFDYEKLAPGVFRVTPRADLAPGEYCFAYASQIAAGFSKVFDFGVTGRQ
jgi:hypothetical protein